MAETLTVLRLGVPPTLARTLRSCTCRSANGAPCGRVACDRLRRPLSRPPLARGLAPRKAEQQASRAIREDASGYDYQRAVLGADISGGS
jgi:hypothetical protein